MILFPSPPHSFCFDNFIYLLASLKENKGIPKKSERVLKQNFPTRVVTPYHFPLPESSFSFFHLSCTLLCFTAELSFLCEVHTCQKQLNTSICSHCIYIPLYFSAHYVLVSTCLYASLLPLASE